MNRYKEIFSLFLIVLTCGAMGAVCVFLNKCGTTTIKPTEYHDTRTFSFEHIKADKYVVAEIKNVFDDNFEINRDFDKNIMKIFSVHLKKTRKCKVEANCTYKYYINFGSFDVAERDGFVYVYVEPIILDEPIGYSGVKISEKSEKGWYLWVDESFDDDINKFLSTGGEFYKRILTDAKSKIPQAREIAENSLKKIMIDKYFPLIGVKETEPQRIIIKFKREKSNNIIKLELN